MNGNKKILGYRSYLICIAFLLMIMFSGISFAKTNIDRSITISLNKFYEVPMTEVKAGEILNVEMQVTSGSAVDVLLLKPSDYSEYQNAIKQIEGNANYIPNGSSLRVTSKKYTYTFPEAGDYSLVIDNTDVPKGGAPPMDQVEVNLKVRVDASTMQTESTSGSTPSGSDLTPSSAQPQKTPGFEAIISGFVIVVLFFRLSRNK